MLHTVAVPVVAAGGVLAIALLLSRAIPRAALSAVAACGSLAVGYAAGHYAVRGWPGFPHRDATHILFYLAWWGAFAGLLATLTPVLRLVRSLPPFLFCAGGIAAGFVLQRHASMPLPLKLLLGGTAAALFATGAPALMLALRSEFRISSLTVFGITMATTAIALVAGRSAVLGQLATTAAFAFAPAGLRLSFASSRVKGYEAAIVPCLLLLIMALLLGCSYAMLPKHAALLIAAAPCAAYALLWTQLNTSLRIAVSLGLAVVLCGAALAITLIELPPLSSGEY